MESEKLNNIENNENKETIKIPDKTKDKLFRLYDYNVYDGINDEKKEDFNKYKDSKEFIIQAFGINKQGESASITITGFNPFFYVKVDNTWNEQKKTEFIVHLKLKMGNYYDESIIESKLIKKQKLYGFDNKKLHTFIKISFKNTMAYNKAKKIFYKDISIGNYFERKLLEEGYIYKSDNNITNCYLYEGDIPPLLKLFHLKEISPTGWIALSPGKTKKPKMKKTHCSYEYIINYEHIIPMKTMESIVNYNICSFDIEASSSHGDFPVAIKDYKKLATDILENYNSKSDEFKKAYNSELLKKEILTAFDYYNLNYINKVYPKNKNHSINEIELIFSNFINYIPAENKNKKNTEIEQDESSDEESDEESEPQTKIKTIKKIKTYNKKDATIIDLIKDEKCEYAIKLNELNIALSKFFPQLEGDIVTFIGLSFINYGENKPFRRVIIVKGGCKIPEKYIQWALDNEVTVMEKKTEKDVLLAFTKIIKNDNPHIITGYNITGFDFDFMYKRSIELNCSEQFLKLSRNKDEVCVNKDWRTGKEDIESSKIVLASGEYNLRFPKMPGRIIMDMCVIFRKEFQLSSFKLDFVSSYFISDGVKNIELDEKNNTTKIFSKNLMGINIGTFIKFEEIGFSNNNYKKGKKFEILDINKNENWFVIDSYEELDIKNSKYNWGLAKDDVSPQEIFDLANGTDYDRWTVGKYCLGDCDNVLWLLLKVDVITDKVEMSNLCDVPLSYLMLRGQGIKLQSYVSKKCGEKNTLMPTIQKSNAGDGYEGAHVFQPVTGLYLEDPVACVDYSSLYPSSIISENLSHDSKVWTKEYDLSDNLIKETGEKDENNNYIYDNLFDLGYKYVDVKYDTFKYIRPTEKAAAKKTVVGYKICRFAQFPDGKAIMPAILEELLAARKSTRKLIPLQNDEFMKNILDKRQLSIKVTANSLYGQMGAVTSAFHEPDVASATTATGRKLLFYGRAIIEECYHNKEVILSDGKKVLTNAECVYGDTDSVFFKFNLQDAETGKKIINKEALIYTIELAKQAGELASKFLKRPHDLEYEKTFWPWCLLSKKRYVGILYEDDPEKGKMKYMGIVLKRRDNAPIVKDIYGGVVEILMKTKNIQKSINFVYKSLDSLVNGEVNIEKLLVTKSLRGYYKNPNQIAHKVLAERIGLRDSGNKPGAGDRMNYAYIKNTDKKALQGDKIETPDFIKQNKLDLDYGHYISNQIMKPLLQLYALELEKITEFKDRQLWLKDYNTNKKILTFNQEVEKLKEKWPDPEKYAKKYEELKNKEVKLCIFNKYLEKLK
jgi:DNA polymerase elongation subunit (family B)